MTDLPLEVIMLCLTSSTQSNLWSASNHASKSWVRLKALTPKSLEASFPN